MTFVVNDVSIEGENRLDKNEPSKYNNLALLQGLLIYKVFLSTLYAPFLLSSLEIWLLQRITFFVWLRSVTRHVWKNV